MSDWKRTAAARRDARNTKGTDAHKPVAGKKDTKRWCRGKVGVEHVTKCVRYVDVKRDFTARSLLTSATQWRILVCTVCGKELANWWPSIFTGIAKEKKPSWVTL